MTEESFLSDKSDNFIYFFKYAKKYCQKHNKKITLVASKYLKEGSSKFGGWCDGNQITIACKNILFEQTFVHEFSHLTQAVEKSPYWINDTKIWQPLEKNKVLLKHWPLFFNVIALERDCEARALRFSKRYDLFDEKQYAKQANIYLYYYQYVFLKQKWIDSTGIYDSKDIYDAMPSTLIKSKELKWINMDLMLLFEQELKKK